MTQEYYIERTGGGRCNFNLWEKDGSRYFNVATLFYQDEMCGTQWTTDDKAKAVNYTVDEIQDELENPLRQISIEEQHLLKLTSAKEVADSLEALL